MVVVPHVDSDNSSQRLTDHFELLNPTSSSTAELAELHPTSPPTPTPAPKIKTSPIVAPRRPAIVYLRAIRDAFLKPAVIAALTAMVIAFTPIHDILVDLKDRDNDAPLQWLFNAIRSTGRAAVPINMLVLGTTLAKGARWNSVRLSTNLLIALSRLVIMPCIGIVTVKVLARMHICPPHVIGPLSLVAMIVTATPTANNIMIMAQLAGEDTQALATVILTQYMLAPITLTFAISVFIKVAEQA